jgi:uncharacterized cupredoxin-like copper-binding protein
MLVWPVAGFFVVIAFGVGLISMAAFESTQDDGSVAASAVTATDAVEVELGDLFIKPEMIHAPAGDVTFKLHNSGGIEHNFTIEGIGASDMIAAGSTAEFTTTLEDGTFNVLCSVPGHADGGMKATLMVGSDAESDETEVAVGGGMAGMTPEEMLAHDAERTGAFPQETEGKGGLPLKPKVLGDGTKRFTLTAEVVQWETEKGQVKEAMAYNGMVPGPRLDVNLGDKVEIILNNELPEPTTLHLHGMTVPNDMDGVPVINQEAILPGDSFTYKFTVRNVGSNMYHSHFNAVAQVPKGLLGAFIVHEPDEVAVDQDYVMILNDGPLGFTLNGKSFPATEPIVAAKGDLVRIRYMNEGLQIHPMHLHGMPQKVIAKDGHPLENPYMADTVLVGPGERYDVLVEATELGAWAYHCHILSHAEGPDGMFGMVTALIVQ